MWRCCTLSIPFFRWPNAKWAEERWKKKGISVLIYRTNSEMMSLRDGESVVANSLLKKCYLVICLELVEFKSTGQMQLRFSCVTPSGLPFVVGFSLTLEVILTAQLKLKKLERQKGRRKD